MSALKKISIIILFLFPFCLFSQSMVNENNNSTVIRNKNNIEFRTGLLSKFISSNQVNIGSVVSENESKGFIGALTYTYWLKENFAVSLYAGAISANANIYVNSQSVSVESAAVIPILFGIKYEPINLDANEQLRPYLTVSVGPFLGYVSNVYAGSGLNTQSISESAFGSYFGAGIDISISKLLLIGIRSGYFLVSDFNQRIGQEINYSSPEFSFSFGVSF